MRITQGQFTIEGNTIDELKALLADILPLLPKSQATVNSGPSMAIPDTRERELRDKYAAAKGVSRARFTPGILGGMSVLEYLEAWERGDIATDETSQAQGEPSESIDLDTVPV